MAKKITSRKRGVRLDPVKLKDLATSQYYTFDDLKDALVELFGEKSTTFKNVLSGKTIDKNRATKIALHFGLDSYDSLLLNICTDVIFPEPLKWDAHNSTPGALLKAEYAIVPFHHRDEELRGLEAWCLDDNDLAVRLYTGAGGMGKTRLAIEQCNRLDKRHQWTAGFLRDISSSNDLDDRFSWLDLPSTKPLFIVVDYAETRREELVALLKAALRTQNKVRIVLLARAAAEWWNLLKTERQGVGDLLSSPASSWITLQPLTLDKKKREKSFYLAAESFAKKINGDPPLLAPEDINADYYERVLLLHMQALISVEQKQTKGGMQGILASILNRERKFWEERAQDLELPKSLHHMIGGAMARITLMGGVKDAQDAARVLDNIQQLADSRRHERDVIIKLLHDLYPCNQEYARSAGNTVNCNFIEPLEPDLLGEHLIEEELEKDSDTILDFIFNEN